MMRYVSIHTINKRWRYNAMSFVLFAGCQYFGILIGDKRVLDSNGKILDENMNKVRKINNNLIIGAGGDEALITLIYNKLFDYQTNNMLSIEQCIDIIKAIHSQNFEKKAVANLGICEKSNIIKFCLISIDGENIAFAQKSYGTNEEYTFAYIASGSKNLDTTFFDLFKKSGRIFSISNIKSVFYQTLKSKIKEDITINDRFSYEILVRSDIYDERKDKLKTNGTTENANQIYVHPQLFT